MSKKYLLLAFAASLLLSMPASAEEPSPQVMMIGVFHFANPGLDVVKTETTDVMDPASQAYLEALTARIVEVYRPTKILLEYSAKNEEIVQGRYKDYLTGAYTLGTNEIYQLGFRIAKKAGGVPVISFDDQSVEWDAGPLFEILPVAAPEIKEAFDKAIADFTSEADEDHRTKSLRELLLKHNDPASDRQNMDLYLLTNAVASEGKHEGTDATASWWHRNFRMYAKIQRQAAPGERLLVIGGQGHTAILKVLLDIDGLITGVDVRPLF